MRIVLNRFWDLKKQVICENTKLGIDHEINLEKDRMSGLNNGEYDIINNKLIAVFSKAGKNFLSLNGKLVFLSDQINIGYHVAQFEDIESWFKIYDGEKLIFEITYINPHKPFILPDPFAYDEDFNITNFAHHLANYIKKVKDKPNIILFPNNDESPDSPLSEE
jgi:hypothetical protein